MLVCCRFCCCSAIRCIPCQSPNLPRLWQQLHVFLFFLDLPFQYQIRKKESCPAPGPCCVTLRGPPLDSETGWTGELLLNTSLLKWQNYDESIFSAQIKYFNKITIFWEKKGFFWYFLDFIIMFFLHLLTFFEILHHF